MLESIVKAGSNLEMNQNTIFKRDWILSEANDVQRINLQISRLIKKNCGKTGLVVHFDLAKNYKSEGNIAFSVYTWTDKSSQCK